jgi:transposase
MGVSYFYVVTDGQWALIQPLLPSSIGRRGRPFRDDRRVVEGIIYRYRCGIAWRDVPAELVRGRRFGSGTAATAVTELGTVSWPRC